MNSPSTDPTPAPDDPPLQATPREAGRREPAADHRELVEFCRILHLAGAVIVDAKVTPQEVQAFLEFASPPPSARLRAALDALPDLLPGATERRALYRRARAREGAHSEKTIRLDMRSAYKMRATSCEDASCWGRDPQIRDGVNFLKRPGCQILAVTGEPGIGKTTLARAVAQRFAKLHANLWMLPSSNVCFFNCENLGTQRELSGLLFSHFSGRQPTAVPEDINERLAVLSRCLTTHLSGLQTAVWIFDGLDDYLRAVSRRKEQIELTAELFRVCACAATNLKIIVTARDLPGNPVLNERLKTSFHLHGISLVLGNVVPGGTTGVRTSDDIAAHPLARRLSGALAKHVPRPAPRQTVFLEGPTPSPASLLERACRISWDALTKVEKEVLRICNDLPGGVWFLAGGDDGPHVDRIEWERIFPDQGWPKLLPRLQNLEWLTEQEDKSEIFGRSRLYRLRPALSSFVRKQTTQDEHLRINRLLIHFWARNLQRWSRIIAGRLTDAIEPRLPLAAGRQKTLLAEENARYLIDVSRLNWLLAFRRIGSCDGRNVVALHYLFLRGTICYSRMTGSLTLFEAMTEMAFKAIRKTRSDGRTAPWRRLASTMYLVSCHDMRGRTLRRLGKFKPAEASLEHAAKVLRTLPLKRVRVRHELAWTLTELGRVHQDTGRWQQAGVCLEEAIAIRRGLIEEIDDRAAEQYAPDRVGESSPPSAALLEKKRSQHLRCLATSLNIYGNVLNERSEWIAAEKYHFDALSIRLGLEENQSYYFQRYIAHCLNDYANSLYYQGRYQEARKYYLQALEIREKLVPDAKNGLGQYVARSCNNIANTLRKLGEWSEARQYLERAVGIYRACSQEYPARFGHLLARTLTNLGRVCYHQGLLREALLVLEEADRLHVVASRTVVTPFKWVETCNLLAVVSLEVRDFWYALKCLDRAENLLEEGKELCPVGYTLLRAFTLNTRARVLLRGANPAGWRKAESLLRASQQMRASLQKRPDVRIVLDLPLAENWYELGCALLKLGEHTEAEIYLKDSLNVRRQHAARRPKYVGRLLARTLAKLADLYMETDREEEACSLYGEARPIFAELHHANPKAFGEELCHVNDALIQLTAKPVGNSIPCEEHVD